MLRPRKLFQDASVQLPADVTIAREGQVWIDTGVPAFREDAGSVFRIMQQSKTALGCSFNQRFSIWTGSAIALVYMLAVKITSVETGVWEHWDGWWCHSRCWGRINVDDFHAINIHTEPLYNWSFQRLISKGPTESLINKRSETMLPAHSPASWFEVWYHLLIRRGAVSLL